jgi:prenyltransferase beta subunit
MFEIKDQKNTISFLQQLQQPDGGYAGLLSDHGSALRSTLSAVKALKLLNTSPLNASTTVHFIQSRFDKNAGSFADGLTNEPSVSSTACALLALHDLGMQSILTEVLAPSVNYMTAAAISAADHFMIIAVFDECQLPPPPPERSVSFFYSIRQQDGSFGECPFLNAIACAALLRAGQKVTPIEPVIKTILNAQHKDGSFKSNSQPSHLMTTYAAMRLLTMLGIPPALEGLKNYLFSLHNTSGGFSFEPAGQASADATYQVITIFQWMKNFINTL